MAVYNKKLLSILLEADSLNSTKSYAVVFFEHCIKWKYSSELNQKDNAADWFTSIFNSRNGIIKSLFDSDGKVKSISMYNSACDALNKCYNSAIKNAINSGVILEYNELNNNRNSVFETFFSFERIIDMNIILSFLLLNAKSDQVKDYILSK